MRWRNQLKNRSRSRTSLGGIAAALEGYLPIGTGYFVELGANDGIRQSNTFWLEVERGWHGLLVEPAINRYFELRANRSDDNSFACAACVPFGYTDTFVDMTYADLMSVSNGLPTDLGDANAHLESARAHLRRGEDVVRYGALARTLQSLLDDAGAPAVIDLLSLDVEGAEIPVLSGIDHGRTRFRFMLIECRSFETLGEYLNATGYEFVEQVSGHDYLFRDARQSPAHEL